jgi:hypothetical protein
MSKNNLNRNDSCYCGNGKKYKVCHGKQKKPSSPILYMILVLIFGVVYWIMDSQSIVSTNQKISSENKLLTSNSNLEPAPPGKVWSTEHNHWHDKPNSTMPKKGMEVQALPKSIEDPPLGKVWSPEHNHWHDEN